MSAPNLPNIGVSDGVEKFKFWCQKVLPLVYDDSLSYYEVLCKVVAKLNDVLGVVNDNNEDVSALYNYLLQLKPYLDTLDSHMSDIDQILAMILSYKVFDNVHTMTNAENVDDLYGAMIMTRGYYGIGDGGNMWYQFFDTKQSEVDIARTGGGYFTPVGVSDNPLAYGIRPWADTWEWADKNARFLEAIARAAGKAEYLNFRNATCYIGSFAFDGIKNVRIENANLVFKNDVNIIKNLTVENSNISGTTQITISGSPKIENCYIKGGSLIFGCYGEFSNVNFNCLVRPSNDTVFTNCDFDYADVTGDTAVCKMAGGTRVEFINCNFHQGGNEVDACVEFNHTNAPLCYLTMYNCTGKAKSIVHNNAQIPENTDESPNLPVAIPVLDLRYDSIIEISGALLSGFDYYSIIGEADFHNMCYGFTGIGALTPAYVGLTAKNLKVKDPKYIYYLELDDAYNAFYPAGQTRILNLPKGTVLSNITIIGAVTRFRIVSMPDRTLLYDSNTIDPNDNHTTTIRLGDNSLIIVDFGDNQGQKVSKTNAVTAVIG